MDGGEGNVGGSAHGSPRDGQDGIDLYGPLVQLSVPYDFIWDYYKCY